MTRTGYRYDLSAFLRFLGRHAVQRPEDITPQLIRLYLHELHTRNLSAWTLSHHARSIRAFCNFLVAEELIPKSRMAKIPMPRLPKQILPAFTVDDVRQLLAAVDTGTRTVRDLALLLALLDTGCRAGEFIGLTVGDVDMETGKVTVIEGKGRKDRVTYLGKRALAAMRKYLRSRHRSAPSAPLWVTDSGTALTTSGLRQLLERLARRAGVPDVHPHKFRRTFAIWSLRAGMNIYSLQALMGHADLKMLQRYLALVEADLEAQHREHGAVDTML
jgi:site-specific recombinase XerD